MACVLDKEKIRKIKDIETQAYPPHMRAYEDIDTPEDVQDYVDCDGESFCHVDEGWYMLGCNSPKEIYVADLAAARPLSFVDMNKIVLILRGMGEKIITAECRQSTSYKMIKLLEKRGKIEIMNDRFSHNWGDDTMREVEFILKPQGFREWLEMNETLNEVLDPELRASLEKNDFFSKLALKKLGPRASQEEKNRAIVAAQEELRKAIENMERDPAPVDRAEAYRRLRDLKPRENPTPAGPQQDPGSKADMIARGRNIERFKQMNLTSPMLYSLAFFAANGANDQRLDLLAREMSEIPKEARQNILFLNRPKVSLGRQAVEYDNIEDFSSAIHSLAQIGSDYSKSTHLEFDPKVDILPESRKNLVAQGGGIWIYKGSDPTMCRLYGKGGAQKNPEESPWCVAQTSNTHYYFDYRIRHGQTQFFIFDTNKAATDPARRTNPGIAPPGKYSEWVDLNNSHNDDKEGNGFGINGYSSIDDYKDYLAGKLGMSVEKLDQVMSPEPVTDSEIKLKKYLDDYASAS